MIDYTDKDCCLNCSSFGLWDGDYCCISKFNIHQYGGKGYPYMNVDIDNTMETPETCKEYYKNSNDGFYMDEYKQFKKFDKLCKQLEAHVKDYFNI